jgi:hypothetical protein
MGIGAGRRLMIARTRPRKFSKYSSEWVKSQNIALIFRRAYTSARSVATRFRYANQGVLAMKSRTLSADNSAFMAVDTRMGPKARIKRIYALADKAQLPARLYYENKLLGTIIQ